jgi:hypothetical protein
VEYQVAEIPRIRPAVDEYGLHRLTCCCWTTTRAQLPEGVPTGRLGMECASDSLSAVRVLIRASDPDY